MIRVNTKMDEYDYEIQRIVLAFAIEISEVISKWQAYKMWKEYSEALACNWRNVPRDYSEIVNKLSSYFEVV